MMRRLVSLLGVVLLSNSVAAQPDMAAAISALNVDAKTKINWNTKQAKRADVTRDGQVDTVMFGTTSGHIWVGIVSGAAKPQLLQFSRNGGHQDGFCAAPKSISLFAHSCSGPEDSKLPDCTPVKTCRDFAVEDDACDSFNFYWDGKRKLISWWRN